MLRIVVAFLLFSVVSSFILPELYDYEGYEEINGLPDHFQLKDGDTPRFCGPLLDAALKKKCTDIGNTGLSADQALALVKQCCNPGCSYAEMKQWFCRS